MVFLYLLGKTNVKNTKVNVMKSSAVNIPYTLRMNFYLLVFPFKPGTQFKQSAFFFALFSILSYSISCNTSAGTPCGYIEYNAA
jgi:hypothetical protein